VAWELLEASCGSGRLIAVVGCFFATELLWNGNGIMKKVSSDAKEKVRVDAELVATFNDLRKLRLEVLREQLLNVEKIAVSLAQDHPDDDAKSSQLLIKKYLIDKIKNLEVRLSKKESVQLDEIELFSDLLMANLEKMRKSVL
jgi:hypothetical protein